MTLEAVLLGAAFVALLVAGVWVPIAIALVSLVAIGLAQGLPGLKGAGLASWSSLNLFTLTAVPLFLLMAEVLLRSGAGERLYRGLEQLTRRLPGGLLQTNIAGCAMFSAISGSSVATAAAIATVALPRLQQHRYAPAAALGSLAAGGTLGILIPPSIPMILYATFTEVSVRRLFLAGVIPGCVLAVLFMLYIALRAPAAAGDAAVEPRPRLALIADLLPTSLLIALVLGVLYLGYATPTESAAVGCAGALLIATPGGRLSLPVLRAALRSTVQTTASILFVVLTAVLLSYAMTVSGASRALTDAVASAGLGRTGFLVAVFALYSVLGCFVESIAMIVITVPTLFPLVLHYGIDPVWFGVVLVVLVELGQITPPFGINLFVIQAIAKAPFAQVLRGAAPYYVLMLLLLAALVLLPGLALWLPSRG